MLLWYSREERGVGGRIQSMIQLIGRGLRRVLPPKTYKALITCWRYRLYWQQQVASRFTQQKPDVDILSPSSSSEFGKALTRINLLAPTPLCLLMHWHGSDKSLFRHNYTTIYDALLSKWRRRPLRVFELGLGSNSSQFAFNMWAHGIPGASLRGWREYFPHASIFGADIDHDALFQDDRIRTFYCDQLDPKVIRNMWTEPDLHEGMDLIIDDGLHTFAGNFTFLTESLAHLRPGGFFVVEDITADAVPEWRNAISVDFAAKFPRHEFILLRLPNRYNCQDNNLLIVHRPS